MFKFINKSKQGAAFQPYAEKLYTSIKADLGFEEDPTVVLIDDEDNMGDPLGKTAYYSPQDMEVVLYCSGRHIKDILRSFAHELIHHSQNCRGDLSPNIETSEGYAQNDDFLRNMEKEAYLKGNMSFRDWEDKYKNNSLKESKIMKRKNRPFDADDYSAIRHKKRETANRIASRLGVRFTLNENGSMFGDTNEESSGTFGDTESGAGDQTGKAKEMKAALQSSGVWDMLGDWSFDSSSSFDNDTVGVYHMGDVDASLTYQAQEGLYSFNVGDEFSGSNKDLNKVVNAMKMSLSKSQHSVEEECTDHKEY